MATKIGSVRRTGTYTEAHRCRSCGRAFWADSSWNYVTVVCPHCKAQN